MNIQRSPKILLLLLALALPGGGVIAAVSAGK